MKLAIASPSGSQYSETFIQMQMERLPCVLRIHGGPVASETLPGGSIDSFGNLQGWADILTQRLLRRKGKEATQQAELGRRLRRSKINILLANFGPTGVALLPVCRQLTIPLVVHFHGYDAHQTSVVSKHANAYRRLGQEAKAIVVVSNRMADDLTSLGIPPEKIHLCRCGVDPSAFPAKTSFPTDPLFFSLGRFVDKKAPYLAMLAFKQVLTEIPRARLIMAGDGLLEEACRNLSEGLGISHAVEFPGVIKPAQVAAYMLEATALIQHSIVPRHGPSTGDSEGTPVTILQSMIAGLPVISTRHAGIAEVIQDSRTGLLVEERDVVGMGRAMVKLAQSPDMAWKIGRASREHAMQYYTADHYISSLHQILSDAASR